MDTTEIGTRETDRQCGFIVRQVDRQQCPRRATHVLSHIDIPGTVTDGTAYFCEYHFGILAGMVASKKGKQS